MKYVIACYVRGRWTWLRVVRTGGPPMNATLKQPFLEWAEREHASVFESKPEAQQWAPPGASIMPETWRPRSARMGAS
jgi:hypothetical protein